MQLLIANFPLLMAAALLLMVTNRFMPFRLRNASVNFQRHMDNILQGMINALAYIDDIIVFSANEQERKIYLADLFQRLSKHGMVINPTKSELELQKLKLLGHLVTPEGILPLSSLTGSSKSNSKLSRT